MCFKKKVVVGSFTVLFALLSVASFACEQPEHIVVENQTSQTLTVYVEGISLGIVEPGEQVTQEFPGTSVEYLVVAKNTQGETLFSEIYTFNTNDKYHLQKVGNRVYKAVIPPLKPETESSDNVTGNSVLGSWQFTPLSS